MKSNKPRHSWDFRPGRGRALLAVAGAAASLLALQAQVLPPPPAPAGSAQTLSASPRLRVREFRFEGNTAFTSAELAQVTAPFTQREISTSELEEARRAVSLHYVNAGYINSGAIIPDQDPADGVVLLRIVEGRLSGVELHGNRWLRDGYLRSRVERWATPPLNVHRMQEGLQLLRQNPNVTQINAELKPGLAPGESLLDVKVEDQQPFRVGLEIDNHRPPSVGEIEMSLLLADLNLTGHGDPLQVRYGVVNSTGNGFEYSGADNIEASYLVPLTATDTTLGLHWSRLNTSIVEETFRPLDIESLTSSYGLSLRQPVYQTVHQEVALSLGLDYRENTSWLLGERFNISPGAANGEMSVTVLRFSQEWLHRGLNHVLALRSTLNFGLDAFDATKNVLPGDPDGQFFSWVGQGQYVQRLFNTQNQLVLRLTGQWTAERLLALEQMSVGGIETVRGYPENQLVRDRGVWSSAEFRVPVFFNKAGAPTVQLAPFFDAGTARNEISSPGPSTVYSTGIGLLLSPNKHLSAQLYWGYRLREVDIAGDAGAQDLGLSFRITLQAF